VVGYTSEWVVENDVDGGRYDAFDGIPCRYRHERGESGGDADHGDDLGDGPRHLRSPCDGDDADVLCDDVTEIGYDVDVDVLHRPLHSSLLWLSYILYLHPHWQQDYYLSYLSCTPLHNSYALLFLVVWEIGDFSYCLA
jgi:hypothetical protein